MTRLYVLVEGLTEEQFVKKVLYPHLMHRRVFAVPIIVTTQRDHTGKKTGKGGGRWKRWLKDLRRLVAQNPGADVRFTTLFDLYGLPDDFPALGQHGAVPDTCQRSELLQQAMRAELDDHRLVPYLQRHEFEALVLAGLDSLELLLDAKDDLKGLKQLQCAVSGVAPEDIDDGVDTAPSKRLAGSIPGYRKTIHGPLVLEQVGLARLRAACPRFDAWVTTLEQMGGALSTTSEPADP